MPRERHRHGQHVRPVRCNEGFPGMPGRLRRHRLRGLCHRVAWPARVPLLPQERHRHGQLVRPACDIDCSTHRVAMPCTARTTATAALRTARTTPARTACALRRGFRGLRGRLRRERLQHRRHRSLPALPYLPCLPASPACCRPCLLGATLRLPARRAAPAPRARGIRGRKDAGASSLGANVQHHEFRRACTSNGLFYSSPCTLTSSHRLATYWVARAGVSHRTAAPRTAPTRPARTTCTLEGDLAEQRLLAVPRDCPESMCQENGPNSKRTHDVGFIGIDCNTVVVELQGQHDCHCGLTNGTDTASSYDLHAGGRSCRATTTGRTPRLP